MFGSLGLPELMLIFIVALIVFGPKRLPDIGRTLGKALGEFKKATDDFKNTIEREVRVEELKELRHIPTTVANAFVVPPTETVSRAEPVTQVAAAEPVPAAATVAAPVETKLPPAAPQAE